MSFVNSIVDLGSAHPQVLAWISVTTFVTSLMSAVIVVADWWFDQRRWQRLRAEVARERAERRSAALVMDGNILRQQDTWTRLHAEQEAKLQALTAEVDSFKMYRRNQSSRLSELEDLVDLLNKDSSDVIYTLEDTQPLPTITAHRGRRLPGGWMYGCEAHADEAQPR